MRFECFSDPCGAWIVWDLKRDTFAQIDGMDLMSLSRQDAHDACAMLNAMPVRKPRRPARVTRTQRTSAQQLPVRQSA